MTSVPNTALASNAAVNPACAAGAGTEPAQPRAEIDLVDIGLVRRLIRWRGFPYAIQFAVLLCFVGLVILSWHLTAPAGAKPTVFARAHLTTLLVWGLWWPAMIWAAVLLGRVWCMVCPLELVNNAAERLGRRCGIRQRALPAWVAGGALIVGLYGVTHILVYALRIDRVPAYTAWFLLSLILLAGITGVLFRSRAYCRGFCPVGSLLGVYGRGGMLAVRPKSADVCAGCAGGDCRLAANRNRHDARSCPSLLNPATLDNNLSCSLCAQCIKACRPANMRLVLRWPFTAVDARPRLAPWPLTLFVMIDSGFVVSERFEGHRALQAAFLAVPRWLGAQSGHPALTPWLSAIWFTLVFPMLTWSGAAGIARLCGWRASVGTIWRRVALPFALLVASVHMGCAVRESVDWGRYLSGALRDPAGVATANALAAGTVRLPPAALGSDALALISVVLIAAGMVVAWRELRLTRAAAG